MSAASITPRRITGVVVSSGLMSKTVKVRIGTQKWNAHIKKNFNRKAHLLVHDPRSSLRTGDIIALSSGWRTSKMVHHVVEQIIAPFGAPIEERPAVMSVEERVREREERKRVKDERRAARRGGKKAVEGEAETEGGMEEVLGEMKEEIEGKAGEVRDVVEEKIKAVKKKVESAVQPTEGEVEEPKIEGLSIDEPAAEEKKKKSWWG